MLQSLYAVPSIFVKIRIVAIIFVFSKSAKFKKKAVKLELYGKMTPMKTHL